MTAAGNPAFLRRMSNVLADEKTTPCVHLRRKFWRWGDSAGRRLLWGTARVDWPARPRPVERRAGPAAPSADGPAPPRASARPARLASDRGRRPPGPDPAQDAGAVGRGQAGRPVGRHDLRPHPSARRRRRGPPHPRHLGARQETWPRCRGRRRHRRARPRRPHLPLPAALSRPPADGPLSLRQVDPLIRQLTLYRDLIDRRTGDPS